jgi:glycosyltransferase involved in cell wall biosynthesis
MPLYDNGPTLIEAVASVQEQTLTSWELIVAENDSNDAGTREALEQIAEISGVRLFRSQTSGVIADRNAAISEARGEFLCCLDPGELIAPTYLEKAVLLLDDRPDIAITYPWTQCLGEETRDLRPSDLDPKLIAIRNDIPVAAVMRREVFEATSGLNTGMAESSENWEFWAHAAELGFRGRAIPEHLILSRHSGDMAARDTGEELGRRIVELHPGLINAPGEAPITNAGDVPSRIDRQPFQLPHGKGRPLVFFVPWLTRGGGGERFVSDLAGGLVGDGRTVVVVVTLGCPEGMTDATEEMLRITPYVYDLTRFLRPEVWLPFCNSVVWRLDDPILINVGSTWMYDNLRALRQSGRGSVTVVDQLFNPIGHVARSVSAGEDIDLILTAYSGLERLLVDHHKVVPRVATIQVGIGATAVERSRLPGHRPVVGWIGRLSAEKRPEWFVKLAAELEGLATFRLAGEGPHQERIREASLHVSSLELAGFVDDALEFIADCDLLVVTSSIEGIPLVAMEAIACGTPVIATDVGGLPDLIVPGVNGYLVSPDHPRELITRVRGLLEHREQLRGLQEAVASAGLARTFQTDAMLERFREVLV